MIPYYAVKVYNVKVHTYVHTCMKRYNLSRHIFMEEHTYVHFYAVMIKLGDLHVSSMQYCVCILCVYINLYAHYMQLQPLIQIQ